MVSLTTHSLRFLSILVMGDEHRRVCVSKLCCTYPTHIALSLGSAVLGLFDNVKQNHESCVPHLEFHPSIG